jgi:hypothetical protein
VYETTPKVGKGEKRGEKEEREKENEKKKRNPKRGKRREREKEVFPSQLPFLIQELSLSEFHSEDTPGKPSRKRFFFLIFPFWKSSRRTPWTSGGGQGKRGQN